MSHELKDSQLHWIACHLIPCLSFAWRPESARKVSLQNMSYLIQNTRPLVGGASGSGGWHPFRCRAILASRSHSQASASAAGSLEMAQIGDAAAISNGSHAEVIRSAMMKVN